MEENPQQRRARHLLNILHAVLWVTLIFVVAIIALGIVVAPLVMRP